MQICFPLFSTNVITCLKCINYFVLCLQCTNVVTANDAAAIAIQLFRLDARLCDQNPMKVARTTNNPSVSGNTLQEATTSYVCCGNTQDTPRLSHDASVQTNPCTVLQLNPVHTTDLAKSLSDAQITPTTSTCSQTDSDNNSSSTTIASVEPVSKDHKSQLPTSSVTVPPMAQESEEICVKESKDTNEDVLKNNMDDNAKPCEQNGTTDPLKKDALDDLDVASLVIPDFILINLPDINKSLTGSMHQLLKHIATYQTGKFLTFKLCN